MDDKDVLPLILMLYYYHTKVVIAPLPYRDHEADVRFILVLPSFEHLSKQFPPFGYVSLRSTLL
jgi:hypothetical protein